jgi:hypothetical protein
MAFSLELQVAILTIFFILYALLVVDSLNCFVNDCLLLLFFIQAIDVIKIGSTDKERSGCCLHVKSP